MDIWEWVAETQEDLRAAGHERLAFIVEQLPELICNGHDAQAEALVPEGLALARNLDHPWLEVYLRHWLAQSRVVRRHDVTNGLEELIQLLDFSHGERTAACPQSVCVTQDVCVAYGAIDGPGYAEERLAASAEALDRIDVTWPCFHCISTEHAEALLDAGRYQEAERYCRMQLEKAASAGADTPWYVKWNLADALSLQGRHDEALALLQSESNREQGEEHRELHALHYARELAVAGKPDEAMAMQPAPASLQPSQYVLWMRGELAICQHLSERNNFSLGQTLRTFFTTLRNHGALYGHAQIGVAAARLALARGSTVIAMMYLDEIEAVVPRLLRPQRITAALQSLRGSLQSATTASMTESAILDALTEDPERNLELLLQAAGEAAGSEAIVLARCEAYRQTGFSDRARRELTELVLRDPESVQALTQLLHLLVADSDETGMRSLVASVAEPQRARALFYQARLYQNLQRWHEAADALEQAQRLDPDVKVIPNDLAVVYRHLQRYEDALVILDGLVSGDAEASDADWERLVVATLLGQFDKARESARRLKFNFTGEGPIDQPYAYCDILLQDATGLEVAHRADRISPVVARIIQMQGPGIPSVYRDEILFDPVPVNPPESQAHSHDPDSERPPVRFRPIKVLRAGGYRVYDLDGVYPGDEAVEGLRAALLDLSVVLSVRSSEEYEIALGSGQSPVRGLYAFLAAPSDVKSEDLLQCVQSCTGSWLQPVTYRGLLKELGMNDELAQQERWAEEVQL